MPTRDSNLTNGKINMAKFFNAIDKFERVFLSICLAGCTLTLFINALLRHMGYPMRFVNDLALALFAYTTFIGADLAYRNNKLATVELFSHMLSPKGKKIHDVIVVLLSLGLFILMAYLGVQLLIRSWKRPIPSVPNISYGWVMMSVPIGAFLMILTSVEKIISILRRQEEE